MNVTITGIDPSVLGAVHDYYAGWFWSALWLGVGIVCGVVAVLVFIWMVGKAHE